MSSAVPVVYLKKEISKPNVIQRDFPVLWQSKEKRSISKEINKIKIMIVSEFVLVRDLKVDH